MIDSLFRRAEPSELDAIYLMGFDVWSEGKSIPNYLEECSHSAKYQLGEWFVLERNQELLSSLIVYPLGEHIFGIGSIATPLKLRKQGYASELIRRVVQKLEREDTEAVIFLYADIAPEFYERLGFSILPKEAQRNSATKCMIRGNNIDRFLSDVRVNPEYF